jgi:NAD(P)-dependent dehydrogenase (short-subunit alcohol dehydrogenase family)
METVGIVTGSNKGIGYAIVKKLAEMGVTVVLTARDKDRGEKAVASLKRQGLHNVRFYCLDVSHPSSIKAFSSWFVSTFGLGSLDILVNNAAVSFNEINENSVKHAESVINTNYYGAKLLTEALLPLFRFGPSKSRILNITSRLGSINKLKNPIVKQLLQAENLSENQIDNMVNSFLHSVKNQTWKSQGWPEIWTDYSVSKLALNAYTKVLANRFCKSNLTVNSFCPGFTKTSMTRGEGTHTADDSADEVVNLLLLPPELIATGKFYFGGHRQRYMAVQSKL